MLLEIWFIMKIAFAAQIGISCSNGDLFCGSNSTLEKLQCDKSDYFCKGLLMHNRCTINAKCLDGLFCSEYGICEKCSTNCSICTNKYICDKCNSGYYLSSVKQCVPLPNFCAIGDVSGCTLCLSGFYLNSGVCTSCPYKCLSCTNSESCSECDAGYYWNQTLSYCKKGPSHSAKAMGDSQCVDCAPGYFLDFLSNGTSFCTEGPENCAEIVATQSCKKCEEGYYQNFYTSKCEKIMIENCNYLYSPNLCLECKEGYFLHKKCGNALSNCKLANNNYCITCNSGYYLDSSYSCQPCYDINKCKTCTGPTLADCSVCQSGYIFVQNHQTTCSACAENCVSCHLRGPGKCDSCNESYFLTESYTCSSCSIGCKRCLSATKCSVCSNNYRLSGTACIQCGTNCKSCTASRCTSCTNDSMAINDKNCISVSNCSTFLDFVCQACSQGNYLKNYTECSLCPGNYAATCEVGNPERTLSCLESYVLKDNTCIPCPIHCISCTIWDSSTLCTSCYEGYRVNNGNCTACSTSNCKTCNSSDACLECISGHYGTTTCLPLSNHCSESNNTSGCIKCVAGYYLSSINICSPCLPNCAICEDGISCPACASKYFWNNQTMTCAECGSNGCTTCSNEGICTSCESGYVSEYPCKQCTVNNCSVCKVGDLSKCEQCVDNYYVSDSADCVQCPIGCKTCNSVNCITCLNGYYLSGNACLTGPSGCSTPISSTQCEICLSGYYKTQASLCEECDGRADGVSECRAPPTQANGTIISGAKTTTLSCAEGKLVSDYCELLNSYQSSTVVSSSCSIALSPDRCQTCSEGFYLNSTFQCVQCPSGCKTCGEKCSSCFDGYYLSEDNICISCDINCALCSNGTCSKCKSLYYLSNKSCYPCISSTSGADCVCEKGKYFDGISCKTCTSNCIQCLSSNKCKQCNDTYTLNNGKCLRAKEPHCALANQQGYCKKCKESFYVSSNGNCEPCSIENCTLCNSASVCIACATGFFLVNNEQCVKCNISNCASCSGINTCDICLENYYSINSSTCEPCQEGCKYCSDSYFCLECNPGYYLDSSDQCIQCGDNCIQCNDSFCLSCAEGYYHSSLSSSCIRCYPTCASCTTYGSSQCNSCVENTLPSTSSIPTSCECIAEYEFNENTNKCELVDSGQFLSVWFSLIFAIILILN